MALMYDNGKKSFKIEENKKAIAFCDGFKKRFRLSVDIC